MKTIRVMLDEGAYMPIRAHAEDAGLDIRTPIDFWLTSWEGGKTIDTGVHIEIPTGYVGLLKSKSGLHTKHGITTDGVIDSGYTGSIHVKLAIKGESYHFCAGDKIAQLLILPIELPTLVRVEKLAKTKRGMNGFGSTGR